MTGELINTDGLGSALIYIADKLGMTVEQVYRVYLSAQMTMATVQIIFTVVSLVFGIIVAVIVYRSCKPGDAVAVQTALFVGFFAFLFVGLFLGVVLYEPTIAYLCPEYTAMKSLIKDMISVAGALR